MCDQDLVEEWKLFNGILTDCPDSQSDYDINMREELEAEIVRRGGEFEIGTRTHVFNGFKIINKLYGIPVAVPNNMEDNLSLY